MHKYVDNMKWLQNIIPNLHQVDVMQYANHKREDIQRMNDQLDGEEGASEDAVAIMTLCSYTNRE